MKRNHNVCGYSKHYVSLNLFLRQLTGITDWSMQYVMRENQMPVIALPVYTYINVFMGSMSSLFKPR